MYLLYAICAWPGHTHVHVADHNDQDDGNIHIIQDVVKALLVLNSHSCVMSFAIQAMSKAMSTYVQAH